MLAIKPFQDVFLLCFSVVDPDALKNFREENSKKSEISWHCPDIPIVLVGTKVDLREGTQTVKRLKAQNQKPISYSQVIFVYFFNYSLFYWMCPNSRALNLQRKLEQLHMLNVQPWKEKEFNQYFMRLLELFLNGILEFPIQSWNPMMMVHMD